MILEIHNNLKEPQRINCTRIVIRDNFNNPIAVAVEMKPNLITVAHINDSNFHELLGVLGVSDSVLVIPT